MANDGRNSVRGKTGENGENGENGSSQASSESGENHKLEAIRSRYLQCPTITKRLSDAQRKSDPMRLEAYVRFNCFHSAAAISTPTAKRRGNTGPPRSFSASQFNNKVTP